MTLQTKLDGARFMMEMPLFIRSICISTCLFLGRGLFLGRALVSEREERVRAAVTLQTKLDSARLEGPTPGQGLCLGTAVWVVGGQVGSQERDPLRR